jgi:hypothetical protein
MKEVQESPLAGIEERREGVPPGTINDAEMCNGAGVPVSEEHQFQLLKSLLTPSVLCLLIDHGPRVATVLSGCLSLWLSVFPPACLGL